MKILFCFSALFLCLLASGQERKSVQALKLTETLVIDGKLDESAYNLAQPAKDFVQLQPYNGRPSKQKSEVYLFYDQNAVYVGAKLYDTAPDSIYNFLSQRDQIGSSDYFGVYLDPFNQGQVAYGFFVIPSGVQTDIKASKGERDQEDPNWNAIWQSKTRITDDGWIVEMRIPYSALRFPENGGGTWGVNMLRNLRRLNSNNSWNHINNKVAGFIHQEGELTGIKDIKPPVRLSLSPFTALYTELESKNPNPSLKYKGGMDLKYGLSESFTLDMMLIPDFGQIQSDYKKLNLSPYELYYSEKRQFFTEGTELFNRADIFYSRRMGAAPKFSDRVNKELSENEKVIFIPSETQLLNASKISGRTGRGWGIGSLNSVSLASYAVLQADETAEKRRVLVQPVTNYNVSVVDKTLKNNSYISLINTNMFMAGDPFFSNVTATDFQLRNKQKSVALKGKSGISYRKNETSEVGYFMNYGLEKNSGKLQYGILQKVFSDKYNPNDMGYLQRNNEFASSGWVWLTFKDPFWIFRETNNYLIFNHNRMYRNLDFSYNEIFLNSFSIFRNNWSFMFNAWLTSDKNDYYEPRVPGRFYTQPSSFRYQAGIFSDGVKALRMNIIYTSSNSFHSGQSSRSLNAQAGIRGGKKFQAFYSLNLSKDQNTPGFTGFKEGADTIVFAKRDIRTVENGIYASYTFNNKCGLNLNLRHYASSFINKEYLRLNENGSLENLSSYSGNDGNFNMLNADLTFRWVFAPGSELSLAWKKNVFENRKEAERRYLVNIRNIFRTDQSDSFSIRVLYYLDYNSLRNRFPIKG
jgi:hypothetical protein